LPYVKAALDTCKGKFKLFSELPAYAGFYFRDEIVYDAEAAKKNFVPEKQAAAGKTSRGLRRAEYLRRRDARNRV